MLVGLEAYQHGLTLKLGLAVALLAALSAATGMLIYQERQSWAILKRIAGSPQQDRSHLSRSGSDCHHLPTARWRWKRKFAPSPRTGASSAITASASTILKWCKRSTWRRWGNWPPGVAHEIRNPLAGIAGAIEIISKDFPKDHPDREILDDLRQEVRRIEKVLNDLLTYARPKAPQFGMADLKDTVAHTLQFARQQIGSKNVEFSIQIPSPLPRFRMDPEQLHQVLLNLVLNGIQALDQEGKITIQARVQAGSRRAESAQPHRNFGQRYGRRNFARAARENFPALLHHQTGRYRVGAFTLPAHHQPARRDADGRKRNQ